MSRINHASNRPTNIIQTFRVHFHDETHLDIDAHSSVEAEASAKKRRPGNFIKKIKLLKGNSNG